VVGCGNPHATAGGCVGEALFSAFGSSSGHVALLAPLCACHQNGIACHPRRCVTSRRDGWITSGSLHVIITWFSPLLLHETLTAVQNPCSVGLSASSIRPGASTSAALDLGYTMLMTPHLPSSAFVVLSAVIAHAAATPLTRSTSEVTFSASSSTPATFLGCFDPSTVSGGSKAGSLSACLVGPS
jgi:hypothetical protein